MLMSRVLAALLTVALLFGALAGRLPEVSRGLSDGAYEAVQLLLRMGGSLCLWSGIMEVMRQAGLAEKLARLLQMNSKVGLSNLIMNPKLKEDAILSSRIAGLDVMLSGDMEK